jgi:hypothetical protein
MKVPVQEQRIVSALLVAVVMWSSAIADEAASEKDRSAAQQTAPTSEQIAAWTAQLDDNRYLVRERATRLLLEAEAAALDPLLATANGELPEPADRAVWILRRIADSKQLALRRQALERLAQLQKRPQVAAAARDALAEIRHNEAVEAIHQLGGRYVSGEYPMQYGPFLLTPRVELDHQWQGGDAGLAHLRHLLAAQQVIIIGTDVSAAGVAELQHVNHLKDVLLYGTELTLEELPKIQELLPEVKIDYRRGALLGVGSKLNAEEPAVVGTVQPGSAAAEAGVQVGDTIQKFQGQPVPSFKALTTMIGKHRAGEEVTLEILRGGQPVELKLKLGEWKTVNY